jgi:hypothetical protein
MGTWSRPLFARVSHGSPGDYSVTRPAAATGWRGSAFFETKAAGESYTLSEFMDTGCNSHKILDHLGSEQIADWKGLCAGLMARYPVLEWVEFHFYSSDAGFPYCLRYARSDGHLLLCRPAEERDLRFTKREGLTWRDWMMGRTEEDVGVKWSFLEEAYAQLVDRILFRRGILAAREDCFLGGGVIRSVGEPATLAAP